MSELLKFLCPAPNCCRRFYTKEKLENHIKLRHPLLSSSPPTSNDSKQAIGDKKEENKSSTLNTNKTENKPIIKENINNKISNIKDQKEQIKINEIKSNNSNNSEIKNELNSIKQNKMIEQIPKPHNIKQNVIQNKTENKINGNNINENNKINENKKVIKSSNSKGNINFNSKKEGNIISSSKKEKEKVKEKKIKKKKPEIQTENIAKEIDKTIEEIENKITETDKTITKNKSNDTKTKEDKEKKEKLEKERHSIILDNLYSKINSLENYFENEASELQKQFELSEIPVFDDINMENEDQHENENEKEKENQKNIDLKKDEESIKEKLRDDSNLKEEKKAEVLDNKDKDKEKVNEDNNINEFDLTQQQKNYDKGKIIEITDDMIFAGTKFEDYDEIIELDLSKKNIASFMNNRNVPFEEFTELQKLNLSYNWMTFTYDIRFFTKLKELYLNDNKIDDLSFAESLPNLEILNAENNEITYITCLNKCLNLKILKLSQNKIEFLNSTLNTIKNLRKLEELTIKDNPFLTQLFGYKQYFIYNYQNILKLDEEEILDLDRDIAGRFVRENNIIYNNSTKRPMSSRPGVKSQSITKNINNLNEIEEDNEDEENNIFSQTQETFRVGNAIISKEMYVPYKGKDKKNKILKLKKEQNVLNEKDKKKEELKQIIKEQKEEIDNIKLELENINQLNKEYEIMIQDYKIKLEQKKNAQKDIINTEKNKDAKKREKNELLKELEMWKKEYFDLFNRISKTKPSLLTETEIKPKLLSNNLIKKHYDNNFNTKDDMNINLYKSMPNNEFKQILNRPQTARVKSTKSTDFDKICEGIKIMYSKNDFADVLEENTDEEDEEKEKEKNDENEIKNVKNDNQEDEKDLIVEKEPNLDNNEDEKDYDGNDIIPDDEIDELFRKSCADIQKMREEIKFMNESIDHSNKNPSNNHTISHKGGKPKLNPVIVKKEINPNFIGNRGIFFDNKKSK